MKKNHSVRPLLLLAGGLLLSSAACQAALYHITIDTAALNLPANLGDGPFSVDFQLNSGDTLGNNTAIISNFSFTGSPGTPFGAATTTGGASGSLGGWTVTISDTLAYNEFYQSFSAGSVLEFDLDLTQNVDLGATPDSFSFAIIDSSLMNIPTTGFGGTLLQVDLDTPSGVPIAEFNLSTGSGSYSGVTVSAVPEPSAALCGLLACGFGVLRRRRSA